MTEKEALAAIWAMETFAYYIGSNTVTLVTDCKSLKWLLTQSSANPRLTHWQYRLANFNYKVIHRAGRSSGNVDTLSRLLANSAKPLSVTDLISDGYKQGMDSNQVYANVQRAAYSLPIVPNASDIISSQTLPTASDLQISKWTQAQEVKDDINMTKIQSMLRRYTSNEPSEEIANAKRQKYVSKFGGPPFRLVDGLWRYFARDRTSPGLLVVPSSLQDEVLTLCHDKEHRGVTATLRLVSDRFWWPGYRKAVIEHVLTCISCCRYNRKKLPGHAGGFRTPEVSGPRQRWWMDTYYVGLPSDNNNKYIAIMTDIFTRWDSVSCN